MRVAAGAVTRKRKGSSSQNTASAKRRDQKIDLGHMPNLVGYMLRRAQLAVFQDFAKAYAKYEIRPAQYAALTIIERNPGLKQREVSTALGIKRANFVAMCDELEKRGLAERRPIRTDRRSYALHLTEKGEALMGELHALNADYEARFDAAIGEEGRHRLIEMLTVLAQMGDSDGELGDG